jgi:hypothetical protein
MSDSQRQPDPALEDEAERSRTPVSWLLGAAAVVLGGFVSAYYTSPSATGVAFAQMSEKASPLVPAPWNGPQTVGKGNIAEPADGPPPSVAAAGRGFVLVKNWDFGTTGTVANLADLLREFHFRDNFNTFDQGGLYGVKSVAPVKSVALPGQPVEDPRRPFRDFTAQSMRSWLRPLNPDAATVSVERREVGSGFVMPKFTLPAGGAFLGRDILWETRVRLNNPVPGYWFAIWTVGNKWDKGAEMDVVESFGFDNGGGYTNFDARLFHVNSVGGKDRVTASHWEAYVPGKKADLTQWNTFTWLYRKDDTYTVWFNGVEVQSGVIHWTLKGRPEGQPLNMSFIFDPAWGHKKIASVNVKDMPASKFKDAYYEWDYSRIYLRP